MGPLHLALITTQQLWQVLSGTPAPCPTPSTLNPSGGTFVAPTKRQGLPFPLERTSFVAAEMTWAAVPLGAEGLHTSACCLDRTRTSPGDMGDKRPQEPAEPGSWSHPDQPAPGQAHTPYTQESPRTPRLAADTEALSGGWGQGQITVYVSKDSWG